LSDQERGASDLAFIGGGLEKGGDTSTRPSPEKGISKGCLEIPWKSIPEFNLNAT